ncbi:hypothetical protein ACFV1W_19470 [Kitasatospora sp. NPDC059648]|uniref:hypothetical protein n=1 Tax=Kitasatospora sp. NPDC059648 TaxID=3346894 RepID=UPI00367A0492
MIGIIALGDRPDTQRQWRRWRPSRTTRRAGVRAARDRAGAAGHRRPQPDPLDGHTLASAREYGLLLQAYEHLFRSTPGG